MRRKSHERFSTVVRGDVLGICGVTVRSVLPANRFIAYRARRTRGRRALLVEVALCLLLLFLVVSGLIEYGWLFKKSQQTASAARQGALVAAAPDATTEAIVAAVEEVMAAGGLSQDEYAVVVTPDDVMSLAPGDELEVAVELKYDAVRLGFPLVPVPSRVTFVSTMIKDAP